jgi:hypothetical protein
MSQNSQHELWLLNSVPLSVGNDFSTCEPQSIVFTAQADPKLVRHDNVMLLVGVPFLEDAQQLTGSVHPHLLLFDGQKAGAHYRCRFVKRSD